MTELTAAEKYRQHRPEAVTVDVTLPSGHIFKFAKPSKFAMLFEYGQMPQANSSVAVQKWIDQGVIKPGQIDPETASQIDQGMKLCDMVLELSRVPKLVVHETDSPDELDVRTLSDEDAQYLFAWVQSGGDTSLMLKTFPLGPKQDSLASADRKKRGKAAQ
jgi:hypothetical protein